MWAARVPLQLETYKPIQIVRASHKRITVHVYGGISQIRIGWRNDLAGAITSTHAIIQKLTLQILDRTVSK